ncbi:type IV pilus modification protein PilV [Simplicispira psychrophila]|uniref:type IV pilus modification protein PilV n=1 Tax=Simplicispira psychrophila TaxID=80882 RepID=UPI00047F5120|nr:type IV pilus modification protein PilV [Simplicispira psychrophila]
MTTPSFSRKRLRGVSLIESLVAIVVMALGILGIVGVQMRTLADTQTSVRRAQAIRLIEDIGERAKANPNALANINAYLTGFGDAPSVPDCSSGCGPAQLAAYDVAVWKKTIKENLPLGQAAIFIPPAESALTTGQRQLGVMIAWRENERHDADSTFKDNTDTTKILDNGEWKAGAGDTACPDKHTCHLQYLPVASRCAPYSPGGVTSYYCPGP